MIRVIALEETSETQSVIVATIIEAEKRGVRIYVNPYSPVNTLDQFIGESEGNGGVVPGKSDLPPIVRVPRPAGGGGAQWDRFAADCAEAEQARLQNAD